MILSMFPDQPYWLATRAQGELVSLWERTAFSICLKDSIVLEKMTGGIDVTWQLQSDCIASVIGCFFSPCHEFDKITGSPPCPSGPCPSAKWWEVQTPSPRSPSAPWPCRSHRIWHPPLQRSGSVFHRTRAAPGCSTRPRAPSGRSLRSPSSAVSPQREKTQPAEDK